jgi:hypothetical protein
VWLPTSKIFIRTLQSQGITPILFTAPIYPDLVKLLDSEKLRQNAIEIARLTKKYNLQYWDYTNFPLPKNDYFNSDHLNYQGAQLFSKALNEKLELTYQAK